MENTENLIEALRRDNYCLVTDDDYGDEPQYDEFGNLLVCKPESGELMPVPNCKEVRKLYDLPEINVDSKWQTKTTILSIDRTCESEDNDEDSLVWLGQRSMKCNEATRMLIKLVDSEMYKNMMNDKNVVKLKVWQLIGEELERNGYKIAHTPKDVALRTFQKWRNLERTYWRFKRFPPEENEYPKKRKPFFFDDMHRALSNREDYERKYELFCAAKEEDENQNLHKDEIDELLMDDNTIGLLSEIPEVSKDAPPKEAIKLLVSLASTKYKNLVKNGSFRGIKFWERIYDEVLARGYGFATSRRDGAVKLRTHWYKNKRLLKQQYNYNVTSALSYSASLRRQILTEHKTIADNETIAEHKTIASTNPEIKPSPQPKKKKDRDAVRAMLELLNSEKYYKLLNSKERQYWVWEKIYHELESMGYYISGATVKAKYNKLFQKWKVLKRDFIQYEVDKSKGLAMVKPPNADLLLNIVYREVIGDSKHTASDNVKPETNFVNPSIDHSYGKYYEPSEDCILDVVTMDVSTSIPAAVSTSTSAPMSTSTSAPMSTSTPSVSPDTFCIDDKNDATTSSEHQPTTSEQSVINDTLLQIKSLHETNVAVQQENFSKVISLLREQVELQKTLNSLFAQFVVDQTKKRSEHKRHKSGSSKRAKHSASNNLSNYFKLQETVDILTVTPSY